MYSIMLCIRGINQKTPPSVQIPFSYEVNTHDNEEKNQFPENNNYNFGKCIRPSVVVFLVRNMSTAGITLQIILENRTLKLL